MSNFELFEEALNEYERVSFSEDILIEENTCKHININTEHGSISCIDCGKELEKTVFQEREWRYYGQCDNKHNSDPTRVQVRKCEERNIFKDVESMGFSDKIVALANQLYIQVTKGQIFRGNSRKSIIFACIFHAYKISGHPQTHERLIQIFELNRKTGLKGLKHVNLHAPKDSAIHTTYITPVNLVEELMNKFSATDDQKEEVVVLYDKIKNKSSKLNRARPQSIASGLVYYWICIKNMNITLKEFAKKADLSELTIVKIAKEISDVLKTPSDLIIN